jgi:hypothetical protein
MAVEVIYRCDFPNCGRIRTETNHWFSLRESSDSYYVFGPLDIDKDLHATKMYCSEDHLIKAISKLLNPKDLAS